MVYSQEVNVKIGIRDSIQSVILHENRPFVVSLPHDYESSNQSYPVLYVLDGNETALLQAILVTRILGVEMILVAIPNTDRDRDMMPLSTPTYEVKSPGAEKFLSFIGAELIPHIEKNYRSNGERTLRGTSLSGLFVMYAFLEKPELFDNYIGKSAGWYADMQTYFDALIDKAFKNKELFNGKRVFIANSLNDSYDPNKEVHNAMLQFTKKVKTDLGDRLSFEYKTYEEYGHVPYPSFYDGLKYILGK
ncbi:alpha/beta hydrolase [Algoriphagus aquimarinus]|uniref:Alpha/beta hydrolase n=1 Tax=Algoriphagus aquimarinus TaxID=237018 RepID=A0A5C7B4C6_9BACT|nr:alpha/beta hydrolase [Algoriphagus aquimarinus]